VTCHSDCCVGWWNGFKDTGHTFCLCGNWCWTIAQN